MMPFVDPNLRIASVATGIGKHEGENASRVGLESKRDHVHHQFAVLRKLFRHANRPWIIWHAFSLTRSFL